MTSTGNDRNSGYARNADDWYQESAGCVDAFLNAEPIEGTVWDPACGGGNIPERCRLRGLEADGSDLRSRGYGAGGVDFLATHRQVDNIITNPPFKLAEEFVRHALTMARHKVAIVARLSFLEGQRRRPLFQSTPVARVWVHSSRVSMPPGGKDVPPQNGSIAYCWIVWQQGWAEEPRIGWLP